MHEMALVDGLVELIEERLDLSRIRMVRVEVGKMTAVIPDAFRFCFEVRVQGTPLENATLEIVEIEAKGRCRSCGSEVELSGPVGICPCGSMAMDVLRGNELRLKEVEVI